ncbi:MAG TPA: porin, partial [Acetobacteraceae bacterium]|nr:porin [Acetobacteraceae bacterium]
MKMVKSLLLGSAAGLVAVTAGQAADLPVKAKPVEYVKICSLYGAGFYYMPGTDLCIKVGGWVRAEIAAGEINGSVTWGPFNGNQLNRTTSNYVARARAYITADVRNQTEYGTARGYVALGVNTNDVGLNTSANTFSSNRAFVQWAGLTAGLSQSFYDFYSVPAAQYRGGYLPASDTGDPGWWVWAYTAQFGGGFSATISAEARRVNQICNANTIGAGSCSIAPGGFASTTTGGAASVAPTPGAYGGEQAPDVIGNLRLDQAWGGAQIMGALHEVNPVYYGGGSSITSGHPTDQFGWAAGAGLKINFPSIAAGDYFQGQVNASQGALRYLFFTPNTNWGMVNGNREAFGVLSDCVYGGSVAGGSASGCELTSAWGFNASFEHYWTPSWHQSLYGAYYQVSYDTAANNMLCSAESFGTGTGTAARAGAGCSNNWSDWGIGTRLQWDVTKTF